MGGLEDNAAWDQMRAIYIGIPDEIRPHTINGIEKMMVQHARTKRITRERMNAGGNWRFPRNGSAQAGWHSRERSRDNNYRGNWNNRSYEGNNNNNNRMYRASTSSHRNHNGDNSGGNRSGTYRKGQRQYKEDKYSQKYSYSKADLNNIKQAWEPQLFEAVASQQNDDNGKLNFVLDTAANPSFVRHTQGQDTNTITACQVRTPMGVFKNPKATTITLRDTGRSVAAGALVYDKLPHYLLSATPVIKQVGPILLDTLGAAIIPQTWYNKLRKHISYFAKRSKDMYLIKPTQGAICLGATADNVSQSMPHVLPTQTNRPPEHAAEKINNRNANKTASLPNVDNTKYKVFTTPTMGTHKKVKMPKYE